MGKCVGAAVASVVDAQMRPEKIRVGEVMERCSLHLCAGYWSGVRSSGVGQVWSRCGLGVVGHIIHRVRGVLCTPARALLENPFFAGAEPRAHFPDITKLPFCALSLSLLQNPLFVKPKRDLT